MQAEARAILMGDAGDAEVVGAAFARLDAAARDTRVRYQEGSANIGDVLRDLAKPRRDPLHLIVHPEVPHTENGMRLLRERAGRVHSDVSAGEIAALWRDIFQAELAAVTAEHRQNSVVINDPRSAMESPISAPLHVQSIDAGADRQSGFLPPQALADLLARTGAFGPETDVRIHGASFGACTTGSTLQVAAASFYGAYLPDENSRDVGIIVSAMGRSAMLRDQTRIRMGTLLDCAGMHEWLTQHPQDAGIFRLCDDHTKVIPDRNQALLSGIDLRR